MYSVDKKSGADDCQKCIHNFVCKLQNEYLNYVAKIQELENQKFPIKISCNCFKIELPLQRGGLIKDSTINFNP